MACMHMYAQAHQSIHITTTTWLTQLLDRKDGVQSVCWLASILANMHENKCRMLPYALLTPTLLLIGTRPITSIPAMQVSTCKAPLHWDRASCQLLP